METDTGISSMNLKQIEKLSPVKIKYTDICREYGIFCDGGYIPAAKIIIIDNTVINSKREATVLLHEIGHAKCHEKNCKCINRKNHTLGEYHAYRFVMKYAITNSTLIEGFVKDVKLGLNYDLVHIIAAKRIMKLKGWKKLNQVV